ncbi:hypothetical protein Ahy_B08g092850 [Arachis hypogaea]|uniref:Protein FAR1-RELATED SEQUENCE n=1 Tax=Arachis hypogaea TaxID=3818 RepID=A0A444Y4S0_ARAHY|nr:hypothetical protein Ahy_B08g092850 [Arachis hypogaea]
MESMNDSTSNQLNDNDLVYSSETNDADEIRCVVDEKFIPKVGVIFKTLEEAEKFYKHYSKLAKLYEDQHIWIPVYLHHPFWAGMRSTQRTESMHSFFNKFITRNSSLRQYMKEVQAQFRGKVNCITRSMHSTLGFTTYEIVEQSKNIKRRHTDIKSSQDEPLLEPRSKRFDDLVFRSHNICEFASKSEELTRILHRAFDMVMAEMQEYQEKSKEKSSLSHEEATLSDMNDLQSPPCVKTRGRPKNRLGSNLEKKISNSTKKKKKTAQTELNLLDCESTIEPSSSLYNAPDMNFSREDYRSFSFY